MISDLIYMRSAWKPVQDVFPSAKLTDASDDIHEGRFQVELDGISTEDYYFELLKLGVAHESLWFNLAIAIESKNDGARAAIARFKKYRNEIKEVPSASEE